MTDWGLYDRLAHIPNLCHGRRVRVVRRRGQDVSHDPPQLEAEVHTHRGCDRGVLADEHGSAAY